MNINYEIPVNLHRALKVQAAEEDLTLKALIIRLLRGGIEGPAVEVVGVRPDNTYQDRGDDHGHVKREVVLRSVSVEVAVLSGGDQIELGRYRLVPIRSATAR